MIYFRDKKLKKRLHVPEADIMTIKLKKNIDLIYHAKRMHFLYDFFQMTAIAFLREKNPYHIDRLHLFRDTLYIMSK